MGEAVQTFLPYNSYYMSHYVLDNKRLGNQVYREGYTLLKGKWPNHPASKMWRGYEHELAKYCFIGVIEMKKRKLWKPEVTFNWELIYSRAMDNLPDTGQPPWLGNRKFHASHRSNLLRKNPEWYSRWGWEEPDDLPYVWPV